MSYNEEKGKYAYGLYLAGKPFKKVYAAVKKGDKFVVLHNKERNTYSLSGGGVDEGETNQQAILRELKEELNANVKIIKSLGTITYDSERQYKDFVFNLPCVAEIFLTEFVSYADNTKFGIAGEFDESKMGIAEISKEQMLNSVAEFTIFGVKLN